MAYDGIIKIMKEILSYEEMKGELAGNADEVYREFSMKGIPSERPFIGVRIPKIREIVAMIPAEKIPECISVEPVAIEEVLARGMMVARMGYPEIVESFDSQVALISDWCTCDIFCSAIRKKVAKNREDFYEKKIVGLISSSGEFSTRVGVVLLLGYVSAEWLQVIFETVEKLKDREEYYVRMAVAWLVAECFIKYPDETFSYMKVSKLPAWTYNKAISKICDSYRVEKDMKDMLRGMRKK